MSARKESQIRRGNDRRKIITMDDAETIVAMLNGAPFDLSISALEFCQKSPSQLRQLLFHVLSAIVPPQRLENSSESTTCWIMETLRILNYRANIDGASLREGIATGNPDIIYDLLVWLLSQINMLQKRAYLARFLIDVEIPAELLLAEDINKLHARYDALREQFKATHRQLEGLRQIERDPVKAKEHVLELETEREHLQSKVLKLKNRLQDVEKSDEILEAVGEFKSQKVEETKLTESISEQRQALTRTLDKHERAYSNLQQMKTLLEDANHVAFFDKTSQEICALRLKAKQKLPEDVAGKEVHLLALQNVLAGPNKSEGLGSIQAKLLAVNEELKAVKRRYGLEKHSGIDEVTKRESRNWQQTQMGVIVANMSRVANDKVAALIECRDKLQRDLDQRSTTIDEVKSTVLRGEDFKNYVDALRAKSAMYKEMKKEIADLDSEYGALLRNQELLEQQTDMRPQLSTDSADQASKHNGTKNLMKTIDEVNTLIKDIRSQLTPQVKDLKLLRADLQSLEVEQAEKKQHYSDMCSLFDRKVSKLEAELAINCKEYEDEKQKLKENAIAIENLQGSQLQMKAEKENGSVSAKLNFKIEQEQELLKAVQHKQHIIKETEHINRLQMVMMKDLLVLIATKLSLYSSSSRPPIFSTATSLETGDGAD